MTLCYMYIEYFISVFLSFYSFTHINTESPEADPENRMEPFTSEASGLVDEVNTKISIIQLPNALHASSHLTFTIL